MPLTERDYDLLSLYLDGALSASEQRIVESRLESEPEFRAELDALTATLTLLRGMPELIAPRDLRLTPEQAADVLADLAPVRPTPRPAAPLRRMLITLAGAAASFVLVLAGMVALIRPVDTPAQVAMDRRARTVMPTDDVLAAETAQPPPVIAAAEAAPPDGMLLEMAAPPASTFDADLAPEEEVETGIMDARYAAPMIADASAEAAAGSAPDAALTARAMGEMIQSDTAQKIDTAGIASADTAGPDLLAAEAQTPTGLPAYSPLLGILLIVAGIVLGASTLAFRTRS